MISAISFGQHTLTASALFGRHWEPEASSQCSAIVGTSFSVPMMRRLVVMMWRVVYMYRGLKGLFIFIFIFIVIVIGRVDLVEPSLVVKSSAQLQYLFHQKGFQALLDQSSDWKWLETVSQGERAGALLGLSTAAFIEEATSRTTRLVRCSAAVLRRSLRGRSSGRQLPESAPGTSDGCGPAPEGFREVLR